MHLIHDEECRMTCVSNAYPAVYISLRVTLLDSMYNHVAYHYLVISVKYASKATTGWCSHAATTMLMIFRLTDLDIQFDNNTVKIAIDSVDDGRASKSARTENSIKIKPTVQNGMLKHINISSKAYSSLNSFGLQLLFNPCEIGRVGVSE